MQTDGTKHHRSFEATLNYPYKRLISHLKDFISQPTTFFAFTLSAFSSICLLTECFVVASQTELKRSEFYFYLLLVSALLGTIARYMEYRKTCPDGFEKVSKNAQLVAHFQRKKWQFILAKILLAEKLGPIHRECQDLLNDRTFLSANQIRDRSDYLHWTSVRSTNMIRMIEIANKLLVEDFPAALMNSQSGPVKPKQVLYAVETIERFYKETVEFERDTRSVIPPSGFERLHQLLYGWSEPIRHAVEQLFLSLEQLCNVDPDSDETISFEYNFHVPPKQEEYFKELELLNEKFASQVTYEEWNY